MRDGFAAWHFRHGPFLVDMNPLLVAGRLRKLVDAILCHLDPVADADLGTDSGPEIFEPVEYPHVVDPRF
jgi:hypothetical protein